MWYGHSTQNVAMSSSQPEFNMSIKRHNRQYDLVVLGATGRVRQIYALYNHFLIDVVGYTGVLTTEQITTSLPINLKWAVAGRSADKLQNVVSACIALKPDRNQPGTSFYLSLASELIGYQSYWSMQSQWRRTRGASKKDILSNYHSRPIYQIWGTRIQSVCWIRHSLFGLHRRTSIYESHDREVRGYSQGDWSLDVSSEWSRVCPIRPPNMGSRVDHSIETFMSDKWCGDGSS